MKYRFHALQEVGWAIAIAVALVILPALVTLDPAAVVDWRVWLVALGGASVRAAAGAALDYLRRTRGDDLELLADRITEMSAPERKRLLDELLERNTGAPHG